MTNNTVMPANAGIHVFPWSPTKSWIPAFAGMTAMGWSGCFKARGG